MSSALHSEPHDSILRRSADLLDGGHNAVSVRAFPRLSPDACITAFTDLARRGLVILDASRTHVLLVTVAGRDRLEVLR
ncbi:MAG: hypothetical protein QOE72_3933 [Chloroflexota bacterium]|nr:hypothetical protein [Chloroflexota bacterium]